MANLPEPFSITNDRVDTSMGIILVADDNFLNRKLVVSTLREYQVLEAEDGNAVLRLLNQHDIDVILLDILMPGMSGYEVCQLIKSHPTWRQIPVIMLTALDNVESRVEALRAGADDFLSKPVDLQELMARMRTSVAAKRYYDQLETTENVLITLSSIVEGKDAYTNGHLNRIAQYAEEMCRLLGLVGQERQIIHYGSILHDIGKVGISDTILLKPGALTKEEFEVMKTHTIIGDQIVRSLKFGRAVGPIVRGHHERWDGRGYPDGLAGEAIPYGARIISICDMFDALTTTRPYRAALTSEVARKMVLDEAGTHFDPSLVQLFIENPDRFQ